MKYSGDENRSAVELILTYKRMQDVQTENIIIPTYKKNRDIQNLQRHKTSITYH